MSAGKKVVFFSHLLKFVCPNARIIIEEKGKKKRKIKYIYNISCT